MRKGHPQPVHESVDDERTAVLRELRALARKLAQVPGWYTRRRELLRRGRDLGIFHRDLGDASGITESAVIKEVQKP